MKEAKIWVMSSSNEKKKKKKNSLLKICKQHNNEDLYLNLFQSGGKLDISRPLELIHTAAG